MGKSSSAQGVADWGKEKTMSVNMCDLDFVDDLTADPYFDYGFRAEGDGIFARQAFAESVGAKYHEDAEERQ